ncbi:copper amine oxidase N-terminal domain-containing protein [Paenibacillus ginsengarvi]|uniref:Copper amine oxidase-like N-terminal domain-containing protein n=1 Tax=Paenibacillus ginsengarvi TaxID=400777 RepID=A0A3B0CVR0_9BACL|nr:copper amine oxidase N-terminal domain-containing protein [Paenibacillus ginsengarvi]RKN86829.1 hypothetical protein D7M11_02430 [Paenibacillus ginsengarvi]
MGIKQGLRAATAIIALCFWSTAAYAADIKPYTADTVQPYTADSVQPYKADPVQPYKADPVQPYKADSVQPYKADSVQPYKADPVQPYKADSVQPFTADPVQSSKPDKPTLVLQLDSKHVYASEKQGYIPAAPTLVGDTTMVPLRFISEQLEAIVSYDDATKEVTLTLRDKTINLRIGDSIAIVQGKRAELSMPPTLIDDTTFIPLRFVSEALGQTISYNAETRQIGINIASGELPTYLSYNTPPPPAPAYVSNEPTPSRSESPDGGASSNGPLFDLRDGLQFQEGFWNSGNFLIKW